MSLKNHNELYFLQIKNGSIISLNTQNNTLQVVLPNLAGTPDGIQVDHQKGLIYFTNMGVDYNKKDGSIEVCRIDGKDHEVLIGNGEITTPKQLQLDKENGFLYWCDREGGKIFRSKCNGSNIEVLIDNTHNNSGVVDIMDQCVGLVIDTKNSTLYWTQKGPHKGNKGRIFSAKIDPKKQSQPVSRSDINVLIEHLPEPIDLELDRERNILYWTDRGTPPEGNTLNSAVIEDNKLIQHRIICGGFDEAIGLTLDSENNIAYVSDIGGNIYCVDINTGKKKCIYHHDSLTGIAS